VINPFRPSRDKRGPDRFLNLKVAVFCLGAGIAFVGIIAQTWLINVAIGVLLIGVALRFLGRDRTPPDPE
jgi:hypothetical protein